MEKKTSKNFKQKNNAMSDALTTAGIPTRKSVQAPAFNKTPGRWMKDGVDHINIGRKAATALGRMLDFDHVRSFDHPVLGPFRCINSIWFMLRAKYKSDAIRNLTGIELKKFVVDRCGGYGPRIRNFRAIIMHSAWLRIKGSKELTNMMIDSTLPFDYYRTVEPSGIRFQIEFAEWVVPAYEAIRKALKENTEPDLEFLRDTRGVDIYEHAIDELRPKYDEETIRQAEAKLLEEKKERQRREKEAARLKQKQKQEAKANEVPAEAEIIPLFDSSKISDIDAGATLHVEVEAVMEPVVESASESKAEVPLVDVELPERYRVEAEEEDLKDQPVAEEDINVVTIVD